jgi:hypothetical protein
MCVTISVMAAGCLHGDKHLQMPTDEAQMCTVVWFVWFLACLLQAAILSGTTVVVASV